MSKQSVVPTWWERSSAVVLSSKPLTVLFPTYRVWGMRDEDACVVRFEGLDLDSLEAPTNGRVYHATSTTGWMFDEDPLAALLASCEVGGMMGKFEKLWIRLSECPKGTRFDSGLMGGRSAQWNPEDDPDEQGYVNLYEATLKVIPIDDWITDVWPMRTDRRRGIGGLFNAGVNLWGEWRRHEPSKERLPDDLIPKLMIVDLLNFTYHYREEVVDRSEEHLSGSKNALRKLISWYGATDAYYSKTLEDLFEDEQPDEYEREVDRLCEKYSCIPSRMEQFEKELQAAEEVVSKK
jgi:hypothetical protein